MNKIIVKVPENVDFIGNWKGYSIPYGKCIIDKKITGCGFTEFCLTNHDNVILCSPRRLLLENKVEKFSGSSNILYLRYDNIPIDLSIDSTYMGNGFMDQVKPFNEAIVEYVNLYSSIIQQHIERCKMSGLPIKILTTYDSLKYCVNHLGYDFLDRNNFRIVVDEWQSIFIDASFKADVELDFSEYLHNCSNVVYVSATPYVEELLDQINYFKNLDMYVFDWSDTGRTRSANIIVKHSANPYRDMKSVIQDYLHNKFPSIILGDGTEVVSREAVIYLNSVKDICNMIRSCDLTPENTDVICSVNKTNQRKLKNVGFGFSKPNQLSDMRNNKMFTFCTRTVYLGADFYSDNATTWIVSNPNETNLTVDISLDLPQILGRQRLERNPWKNRCTMFFSTIKKTITEEDFKNYIQKKLNKTDKLLEVYSNFDDLSCLKDSTESNVKCLRYKNDYVGYSRKNRRPEFNYLVYLSEQRYWKMLHTNYSVDIQVIKTIMDQSDSQLGYHVEVSNSEWERVANFINGSGPFAGKMRAYCQFVEDQRSTTEDIRSLNSKIHDLRFQSYYNYFGSSEPIFAVGYQEARICEIIARDRVTREIRECLDAKLEVGQQYNASFLKTMIRDIFISKGVKKIPKIEVILEKYFKILPVKINFKNPDGSYSQCRGYRIISKL